MSSNNPFPHFSLSRWCGILHPDTVNPDNNSDQSDYNPISASGECYACTQVGVPAFHSTSCDKAHQPEWEASSGSSLIPIQSRSDLLETTRSTTLRIQHQPTIFDPRSKRVQRWNRAFLLARGLALAIDPLFFYALSIGRGGSPCLYMDGGLAAIVTVLRTVVDAVHLCHLCLQFRLAYVSRESLVVGCGKLVWDSRAIAGHYLRSVKGFWFDVFVILPVPQISNYSPPNTPRNLYIYHLCPSLIRMLTWPRFRVIRSKLLDYAEGCARRGQAPNWMGLLVAEKCRKWGKHFA